MMNDYRRMRPSITPAEVGAELVRRAEPWPMEEPEPDLLPDAVSAAVERARAQQTRNT